MKNFERIVQNKEALAAEVIGVVTNSVKGNINAVLRQIDPNDFTPVQYRYIRGLLESVALKMEMQMPREVEGYAAWLDADPEDAERNEEPPVASGAEDADAPRD